MVEDKLNPVLDRAMKTPEREARERIEAMEETESLAKLVEDLDYLREQAKLKARRKDLEHIEKIDKAVEKFLETLTNCEHQLSAALQAALMEGNLRPVEYLASAIRHLMEVREKLLGFDPTRAQQPKRRMKLQVLWKTGQGAENAVGVSVETE